jgi:drug/metabolite transporter (DMT)-like permease
MTRNQAYLMLAGSALFWSGNFVIGRAFASDIAPLTLSYLRWQLALLILLPFTLRPLLRQWPLIMQYKWRMLLLGVLGVAGFNTLAYLGLHQTTATHALLINSFIPILIILLSRLYPGLPIRWNQLLGILISTTGVAILIAQGRPQRLLALEVNHGDLWVLGAALLWAIYSIGLRFRPAALRPSSFIAFTVLVGVLTLAPVYWLNPLGEPPFEPTLPNLAAIAYVALFASVGAYLFWNQGVKVVGAGTAGQFIHLMPVFGTIMAVLFLGERLHGYHLVGAAAIGSGIYLSLSRRFNGERDRVRKA